MRNEFDRIENLSCSRKGRETPADLEHMESDELRRMGTRSTADKRQSDQPEESTVKEQRVDDVEMHQGPRDAGATKDNGETRAAIERSPAWVLTKRSHKKQLCPLGPPPFVLRDD